MPLHVSRTTNDDLMTSITLDAPAKVNLFLKVLGKRKDSYHNILTVFEKISLADTIRISKIPSGIEVSSDRFITRSPEDNIAYRAARMLIRKKRLKCGVRIQIIKRIPVAAGLGGGSSDAAAVLLGINRLFRLNLTKRALLGLGAALGADVPFFLLEKPFAIGRSKGERLEAIDSRKRYWHLIANPGFKVSTKDIYNAFDAATSLGINPEQRRRVDRSGFALTRPASGVKMKLSGLKVGASIRLLAESSDLSSEAFNLSSLNAKGEAENHAMPRPTPMQPAHSSPPLKVRGFLRRRIKSLLKDGLADIGALESMLSNDLEEIVVYRNRTVGVMIRRLAGLLGRKAIVSGSGPSVFCLCSTGKEARRARKAFLSGLPGRGKRTGWQVFVARTY
jgi:4-diphosphocytidyl-2C-methyl-D-erythritol kinase